MHLATKMVPFILQKLKLKCFRFWRDVNASAGRRLGHDLIKVTNLILKQSFNFDFTSI